MIYADNSATAAFAACKTKAIVRYGLGYTSIAESVSMAVGRAAHAALDTYLRGGATEKAQKSAMGRYLVEYTNHVEGGEEIEERLSLENTSTVLEKWFEAHREDQLLFYLDSADFEQDVAVKLDDGICPEITFLGRLDGIAKLKHNGKWCVIEHKTTGFVNSYWSSQWHTSSQLTGYMWAASQILGEPVMGCLVDAIEFSLLPGDPVRKCKKHGVTYRECKKEHAKWEWINVTRAPWQIEQWKRDFSRLAMAYGKALETVNADPLYCIDELPMDGTFTGACRFCELKDFCGMGRGKNLMPLLLKHDPWELSMAAKWEKKGENE